MLAPHSAAGTQTTLHNSVLIVSCPAEHSLFSAILRVDNVDREKFRSCTVTPQCPLTSQQVLPTPGVSPVSSGAEMNFCFKDFLRCNDLNRIVRTVQMLRLSGFYYETLSWKQASDLLEKTEVGTFLVRDSADPRFLFSLSVQTERGPTSVRIHYTQGQFRLDSEDSLTSFMPLFDCVVDLVDHYVKFSQSVKASSCVWLDTTGRRDLPIRLYRPLYSRVHSLQHLCRLGIIQRLHANVPFPNWSTETSIATLDLPKPVKQYLREYPHPH